MSEQYTFSVDLAAVEHLGLNLYSNTAAALTEIIANAWDADATEVHINISDDKSIITITDNGHGMSVNDLNNKFLKVAYKRRLNHPFSPKGRPVMGRKGIGKLALFSIAEYVEITSKKENQDAHSLSIDVTQLKNHITNGTTYHPMPINVEEFTQNSGTRFILSRLLTSRLGQSISAMKKRIARRFSVIGDKDNFNVYINNEKIVQTDRDDFTNLQFAWKFSNNDSINFPDDVKIFNFSDHQIIYDNQVYSFDGWLGTALKPKDLNTYDMGNLNGISVISRGRVFQENILDKISENRLMKAYITGVIQADFLDENDGEDIATSDRQRVREDDVRYQALLKFGKKLMNEMYQIWSIERKKFDKEEVVKQYPQLKKWIEELPVPHQKQAEALLETVSNLQIDEPKENDRKELFRSTILAFERLRLSKSNIELADAIDAGPSELIRILSSYDSYEISLYHDVVRARLETIKIIENKINQNDYENKIRDFIYSHLWLIDPTWERVAGSELKEQNIHKAFDEKVKAKLTPEQQKGRFDLRYRNIGDDHIIIELKRPKLPKKLDIYDLMRQGDLYKETLFKCLQAVDPHASKDRIKVVFLIGDRIEGDQKENEAKLAAAKYTISTYDEMLLKAKSAYADFLVKEKEADKIKTLIDSFV